METWDALSNFVNQEADYNFASGLEMLKKGHNWFMDATNPFPPQVSQNLNEQIKSHVDSVLQSAPGKAISHAADMVRESGVDYGIPAVGPMMGVTLKQLQGAPKEAFRKLILGPGTSTNYIDNFTPFKEYVKNYTGWKMADNKADVGNILSAANKIVKSRTQVGDLIRYSDGGFEHLIKGSELTRNPTTLRTSVVNSLRPGLAGVSNRDANLIELAMGTRNVNIPNTLTHEMVHIREEELLDYLHELYRRENELLKHVEKTNPRGSSLPVSRLEYLSRPEEVMARGVASEVSGRMGLKYPDVKDTWYRYQSWPEELNPMWSEIADVLMGIRK